MKTLKVFFVLFLILLEACNPAPTEPNVPPEPVVIVTIPFVEVTTTATTASIKSTVNTNGPTSIAVEYGVGNYGSSSNFVPNSFSVNTTANVKLTELTPDTKYQFRIKVMTVDGTKYIADSTFVTSSQLQIGDTWNKGVVISLNPRLLAAPVDQSDSTRGLNLAEAIEACKNYGEGYRLPDSTELKIMLNAKNAGIIKNFVGPEFARTGIYISTTIMAGNPDWTFCIGFNDNGRKSWISVNNRAYARAVCSF